MVCQSEGLGRQELKSFWHCAFLEAWRLLDRETHWGLEEDLGRAENQESQNGGERERDLLVSSVEAALPQKKRKKDTGQQV